MKFGIEGRRGMVENWSHLHSANWIWLRNSNRDLCGGAVRYRFAD
jgi:hypothetical protein